MNDPQQLVASYGCILNQHQEILIVKRASFDSRPGMWELPGGSVEHGEDPEIAVVRETLEETGLAVTPYYPFATTSQFSSKGEHLQIVRIAFLCNLIDQDQPIQLSSEHSDYRWIPISPLPDLEVSDLLHKSLTQLATSPHLLSNEHKRIHPVE